MMNTRRKSLRGSLLLLVLVLTSWGVYECSYRVNYWKDYHDRPWAYSKDKSAKLLVGRWLGNFSDPDGIAKSIELEIFPPTSEEEREKEAGRKYRRHSRSRKEKNIFDGVATVTSRLGTEHYVLSGSVGHEDYHNVRMNFGAADESQRLLPNFAINMTESGYWAADELRLGLSFAYLQKDGSSHSDSADPRHDHVAKLVLKRK